MFLHCQEENTRIIAGMKSTKSQRSLKEKKRHLESRIAGAQKVLDEMRPEIKEELRRICLKLGISDILEGKRGFEEADKAPLTLDEHRLLRVFYDTIYAEAQDSYELRWVESLLSPQKKGRTPGSRNKQPKAPDPAIAPALVEWETYVSSNPGLSERTIARRLAFKHCPVKTEGARVRFADRLRSARRNSKKWLYRKLAEAMAQ